MTDRELEMAISVSQLPTSLTHDAYRLRRGRSLRANTSFTSTTNANHCQNFEQILKIMLFYNFGKLVMQPSA